MPKNRAKISQSKPKKSPEPMRSLQKSLTNPSKPNEISISISEPEVPSEPDYNTPIINLYSPVSQDNPAQKHSSSEMITENSQQKHEILMENSHSDFDTNSRQLNGEFSELGSSHPKELINQIKELQQELSKMNERIIFTEEEMKNKENEAQELKELLLKLRENQVMFIETSESQSNCKACNLF